MFVLHRCIYQDFEKFLSFTLLHTVVQLKAPGFLQAFEESATWSLHHDFAMIRISTYLFSSN